MHLETGQILNDRYRIVKLLGKGGFGAVYRGWDITLQRPCAVKENLETSGASVQQFLREARILAKLSHPSLPQVYDSFTVTDQAQYLVMEYIEGEDLGEMLEKRRAPLSEAQILPWIIQICAALEYLHCQEPPVIHRDVKPSNIKITTGPGKVRAVLVDFGIAKIYHPDEKTMVGAQAVSAGYSPPEQYGRGVTDRQSDIYALGATLYHLLTGRLPPDSVGLMSGLIPPPLAPEALNPAISPPVSAAIEKAMKVRRQERWRSAAEFSQALEQSISPVTTERPATKPDQPTVRTIVKRSPVRRARQREISWAQVGSLALLGLVVLFGILGVAMQFSRIVQAVKAAQSAEAYWLSMTASPLPPSQQAVLSQVPTPTVSFLQTPTLVPTSGLPGQIVDIKGARMVLVPGGPFVMGGDPDIDMAECDRLRTSGTCERNMFEDEAPIHTITLNDFYIDLTEVTNAMYAACVQAKVCLPPTDYSSYTRPSYFDDPGFGNYPVIHVTWGQAKTYCEWRGARLPTEAEWEKAARGTDGRRFPWGFVFDGSLTNFCDANCPLTWSNPEFDDGQADTAPVGTYPGGASPYGVLDMAGNVWEWVADWYQETFYSVTPLENPLGPDYGDEHVLRGGGWSYSGYYLHVSFRGRTIPNNPTTYIGIRCARNP